jgi:hypothetical protein
MLLCFTVVYSYSDVQGTRNSQAATDSCHRPSNSKRNLYDGPPSPSLIVPEQVRGCSGATTARRCASNVLGVKFSAVGQYFDSEETVCNFRQSVFWWWMISRCLDNP